MINTCICQGTIKFNTLKNKHFKLRESMLINLLRKSVHCCHAFFWKKSFLKGFIDCIQLKKNPAI